MSDWFLSGPFCRASLLRTILGGAPDCPPTDVEVTGFRALGDISALAAAPGGCVRGILLSGVTVEKSERLSFFGRCFAHEIGAIEIAGRSGDVLTFLTPDDDVGHPIAAEDDTGAGWLDYAAQEIMAWHGRMDASAIAARQAPIGVRAQARRAAQKRARPSGSGAPDVEVIAHRRPYLDFFAVEEMRLRYRRFDGTMSPPVERAALMVGGAVVVLPYDPVRDKVLLVEQFRAPLYMLGDGAPWVWEPVAGLIDAGETPEVAAHREAAEEAGLNLHRLEPAGGVYSSTGSSSEFLHLFTGICDLEALPDGGGGVPGEGEDIRSRILSVDELLAGVDAGQYRDMPLVTMALWLARHRTRLRAQARA